MTSVRLVLVRPETAANVGSVARAMRNAGLTELTLVAPGDWRRIDAWRSAWRAHEVLESAREVASLGHALAGAAYVAALSGRPAEGPALDVREMAAEVAALPAGATAALVFGPETSGLAGDELAACGRQVHIPSHPAQPSLNLAQAVMVTCYEVFRAQQAATAAAPTSALATHEQKEEVLARLRTGLGLRGPRGARALLAWRRLLHRVDLAPRELRLLDHLARRLREDPGVVAAAAPLAPARPAPPAPNPADAFEDVRDEAAGFSLPALKWRELLFTGALVERDGLFERDPARPMPPFRRRELFPAGTHFRAERRGARVLVAPVSAG